MSEAICGDCRPGCRFAHPGYDYFIVIDRLDRATQYSRALTMNTNALEYWITRFRG
jgi:hypothetical protein